MQPDVQVQVNLDAKKRATDNQYESSIKLNVTSTAKDGDATLFVLEVDFPGSAHPILEDFGGLLGGFLEILLYLFWI